MARLSEFAPTSNAHGLGTMVMQFEYHDGTGNRTPLHDRVGNRLAEYKAHQPSRSEKYRYDSASRLADPGYAAATSSSNKSFERGTLVSNRSAVNSGASPYKREGWRLDGVNNWKEFASNTSGSSLSASPQFTAFNEWNLAGSTPGYAGYDDNGNALDQITVHYQTAYFQWDAWNRLRDIKSQNLDTEVAIYLYDAHNRRVRKTVIYGGVDGGGTNGTTDYAYQGWRVLWEKHTGDPQTFVYGNYLDEVWNRLRTDGETVSQNYYFLTAVNYSVMAVVDALGGNAIAEAYEYDAYGRHRVINKGSDATYFTSDDTYSEFPFAPGTINNSIRYTGQRFDAESNLMYYKNRYYDPSAGRFIGRDPLGWDEGPNRYGYVGGMPTMAVDPLGLQVTAPPRRPPRRPPPGTGPGGRRVKYETPDGRRTDRLPPDHWTHPIAIDPFNPGPIIIPAYPRVPPAGPMMPPTLMGPKPRTYPDTVNWPSSRGNPFNPPYRYPKKKDAKCSDWEYSVLKELVVKYCKEPPPVGCRLLDSNNREDCALIPKRIDDLFDCWRARDLMIQVCYEGIPDEGHRDARDNAERGMNNCSKKLEECKENGCFP